MVTINRKKLSAVLTNEIDLYKEIHPKSKMQAEKSKASLLTCTGMNWWAGGFPMCIKNSSGATITDIDDKINMKAPNVIWILFSWACVVMFDPLIRFCNSKY